MSQVDNNVIDELTVPATPSAPKAPEAPKAPTAEPKGEVDLGAIGSKLEALEAKLEEANTEKQQVAAVRTAVKQLFTEGVDATEALELLGKFAGVDQGILDQVKSAVKPAEPVGDPNQVTPADRYQVDQFQTVLRDMNERRASEEVNRVLGDPRMEALLQKRAEIDPDTNTNEIRKNLSTRLMKDVYNRVQSHWDRQPENTPFDPKWFSQAADASLAELLDVVKLSVGDPSRIGRAPSTGGSEMLAPTPELPTRADGSLDVEKLKRMEPAQFKAYMAGQIRKIGSPQKV